MAETRTSGDSLLDDGIVRLREILGDGFAVDRVASGPDEPSTPLAASAPIDAVIEIKDIRGGGIYTEALADAVSDLSPTQADRLFRPRAELLRRVGSRTLILVIAPWLSPRTRATLDALAINYLDLTGNVRLEIDRPRVVVSLDGAAKRPSAASVPGQSTLAGVRAGRLVRRLVDVPPPYRVTELAQRTALSPGYVSRLIETISELGLLRRHGRVVTELDWVGLLRERSAAVDLLRANDLSAALAPRGVQSVLDLLGNDQRSSDAVAMTGSIAAAAVAPLSVGGQLMLYVAADAEVEALGRRLELLPTDDGANVVFLRPPDPVVFDGRRRVRGLWHVALSQLALDCLSGPDRLPAAGEAVLQQMIETEGHWRIAD